MSDQMARINIFNITTNPDRPKPYRLKWTIDSRHKSRSFKTKGEAEKFKHRMEQALEDGSNFDPNSGLPDQWIAQLRGFAEVASEYSATKWHEWSASSRASFCDAASVIVFELLRPKNKSNIDRTQALKVIRELILNQNTSKPSVKDLELKKLIIESSYRLKEITPEIVTKTIQGSSKKIDGSIAAYDTQRRRKQTFGAVMDYAFRNNYIKDNSFKRVKVKPLATLNAIDPVKALNPNECRDYCQILRNLAKTNRGYFMESADFLEVIWLAGLRPSEVAGLQVKHVHLFKDKKTSYLKVEQAVVTVNKGYADDLSSQHHKGLKSRANNAFRTVPILDELKSTLERLIADKEPSDYLFTSPKNPGQPIKTDLINDYFRKVCFSNHTPYDLRHTNASILIYSGLNVIEVANRLGNSIEVCQKVYLHMINRVEETSTLRENDYLESTKDLGDIFLKEHLRAILYPSRN